MGCRSLLRQPRYACTRCAQTLESAELVCGRCQQQSISFDKTYAACIYEHPTDRWVQALKFNGQLSYARLMACCLQSQLQQFNCDIPLVPVPLHSRRYRQRGYNQAHEIARELSLACGHMVMDQVLERTRDTAMQSELSGKKRHSNVRNAFRANTTIAAKRVLLVDDVMTTGHTLRACADVLKRAGVEKVDAMVFARA
ncbi:ComF family protein [Marinicella sp. W31]|uniref:ComF family protein n=1 Tax=Marinicella sp. W31 TaxID=3023713 RepID=UPI003757793F